MKNIFYTKHEITTEDRESVLKALDSGFLTQGPAVENFENAFRETVQATYALAVNNGTSALHLAVKALGLKKGMKVLVPALSFSATANCVRYCGGEVEFIDISPETFNIDLEKLMSRVEHSSDPVTGVIVVDFAGYPVQTDQIFEILKKKGIWLLRDASHSPGAAFINNSGEMCKVGSNSHDDAATFSFHPAKHIACGEGGMITTGNNERYQKMKLLRSHGIIKDTENKNRPWHQDMVELGYNYRLPDINASLGYSQLARLDQSVRRRQMIADFYMKELSDVGDIALPSVAPGIIHAWHLFVLQTQQRDHLFLYMKERGIHCQIHYTPINQMSYYKSRYERSKHCRETEKYFEKCISIPMYPSLDDEDLTRIAKCIKSFFKCY